MNVVKWIAISVGGVFALLLVLGIILGAAGVGQDVEKPVAAPTNSVSPSVPANTVKPVEKRTELPKATQKPTPKPVRKTTAAPVDRNEVFLTVLRTRYPEWNVVDDKTLLNAGHNVCTLFESGLNFNGVATVVVSAGFDPEQGGYLIGASTAAFCPKYNG